MDKSSQDNEYPTLFVDIKSPSSPARCCFLEFAIRPALFWQRNNIDNIEMADLGWKNSFGTL